MLPRAQRLTNKQHIAALFRRGVRVTTSLLGFRVRSGGDTAARFAVIVPASVVRKATQRNLVKRRIREALRRNSAQFPQHIHAAVVAFSSIALYPTKHKGAQRTPKARLAPFVAIEHCVREAATRIRRLA